MKGRNEQRYNEIKPCREEMLEAFMTSKLFFYIAHQRKYPLYGVSGSAVHRANRSINVMHCEGGWTVFEKSDLD